MTTELLQTYFLSETVTGWAYMTSFLIVATTAGNYRVSEDGSSIIEIV